LQNFYCKGKLTVNRTTQILIGVVVVLLVITACLGGFVFFGLINLGGNNSGGGAIATAPPLPPTATPPAPGEPFIQINDPLPGSILDIEQLVNVGGVGGGLPEGNVVVEAIAQNGTVLAQQPTTIEATDAGTGGAGPWSTQLALSVEPGTPGQIRAYSPSPADNSIIAEAKVAVVFGQPAGDIPPVAIINAPGEASVGDAVTFDASASQTTNQIVSYAWDLADGTTANAVAIEHIYNAPGIYNVTLEVTDEQGLSNSTNFQINIIPGQEPEPTEEPEGGEIEGVEWGLNGTIEDTEITALFEGGTVSGSSGCNTYSAPYELGEGSITISEPRMTQMACDEAVMNQEALYLSNLTAATSYVVEENALTLSGMTSLVYTAR
jgi:heat shock protein HslJ